MPLKLNLGIKDCIRSQRLVFPKFHLPRKPYVQRNRFKQTFSRKREVNYQIQQRIFA